MQNSPLHLDQGVANIRIFEYIRIFSGTNIRSYHIRIIFLIRIYSDIHSYHFFDMNIFGYSFVLFFGKKYIRIFIRIKNSYSPHPGWDSQRGIFKFSFTILGHSKHIIYHIFGWDDKMGSNSWDPTLTKSLFAGLP